MFHIAVMVAALTASALGFAQVDTTGIEGGLTDAGTAIGVIGGVMLTVAGAGIAFRWILGFLFS